MNGYKSITWSGWEGRKGVGKRSERGWGGGFFFREFNLYFKIGIVIFLLAFFRGTRAIREGFRNFLGV